MNRASSTWSTPNEFHYALGRVGRSFARTMLLGASQGRPSGKDVEALFVEAVARDGLDAPRLARLVKTHHCLVGHRGVHDCENQQALPGCLGLCPPMDSRNRLVASGFSRANQAFDSFARHFDRVSYRDAYRSCTRHCHQAFRQADRVGQGRSRLLVVWARARRPGPIAQGNAHLVGAL